MSESPLTPTRPPARAGRSAGAGGVALPQTAPPEGPPPAEGLDRRHLLAVLTRFKKGDFSVRLEPGLTGVDGKIADAFNEVVELNQRMSLELARLSQLVGKEGRISERASLGDVQGSWAASVGSVNDLIDDLVHPTIETARVIGAVAKGDLSQTMALEIDGRPLQGEFLRTATHRQHDGRPARLVRLGGHARGPRGRHRGQARRPGRGQGRRRHLEGPHRQRQPDGRQPDRPGAQHRRGDHGRRQRRPRRRRSRSTSRASSSS